MTRKSYSRFHRAILAVLLLAGLFALSLPAGEREADDAFRKALPRDADLVAFLKEMPKGGELHTHLAGAVYAEFWLKAALKAGLYYDPATRLFVDGPGENRVPAERLRTDRKLLSQWLNRVSTRGLSVEGMTGHDHFFEAFSYASPAVRAAYPVEDMLVEVIRRAQVQNVSYLEVMAPVVAADEDAARFRLPAPLPEDPSDAELEAAFRAVQPELDRYVAAVKRCLDARDEALARRLGTPSPTGTAAPFGLRYITALYRQSPPDELFAPLAFALAAVRADPRVVGVNLLSAEDQPNSDQYFRAHMRVLDFLWKRLGRPAVTLHAGELTLDIAPLESMLDRIRTSIEAGHARRIGHGVSVMWERDLPGLLKQMRDEGICVEICLTSNRVILGVAGKAHPFRLYREAGVPLCLNTDDEGVSRTNLTLEFFHAVREQEATYPELKDLARNSLEYSFLPGESLYLERDPARLAPGFEGVRSAGWQPTPALRERMGGSPRLEALVELERAFVRFEARFPAKPE